MHMQNGSLLTENNKFGYYYDSATTYKVKNRVKVWTLYDHLQLFTSPYVKPHMSMMVLGEFDCKKKIHRTLYTSTHSKMKGKGEMIEEDVNDEFTRNWHSVPKKSLFFSLMSIICS